MDPTTYESVSRTILADADLYQAKMEQSCSDFQAKAEAEFNKFLSMNEKLTRQLFPSAPSDEPAASSSMPPPTTTPKT